MVVNRPALFIGSSTSGLPIAEALQENLENDFEIEIWNQGTFELGDFNLEALFKAGKRFDFAALVLTPDDVTQTNSSTKPSPRDNVIFELGFFLGILGRKQAFVIHERNIDLKLPTDIDGLNRATYLAPNRIENLRGALGGVSNKIKNFASSNDDDSYRKKQQENYRREKELERTTQEIIHDTLKLVSNSITAPKSPIEARIRSFVFKKNDASLVCSHSWSPNPTKEVVGELMFGINSETEKQVAVVKAAMRRKVCASPISVLPEDLDGVQGDVEKDLCFVLAAPILGPDGEVWGTVDFDASSKLGEQILLQNTSQSIIFELGKLLYSLLSKNELTKK